MRIMRHSTVYLTLKHYTHLSLEDKSAALARLPATEIVELQLTGTDDILPVVEREGDESCLGATPGAGGVSDNAKKQVDRKMDRSLGQNGCILSRFGQRCMYRIQIYMKSQ